MLEVMDNAESQLPFWNRVADDPSGANWEDVYASYRSTVDWPGCHFWRELCGFYPEARVILTLRDPEQWYESVNQTILAGMRQMQLDKPVPRDEPMYFGAVIIGQQDFGGDLSKESVIAAFERHNAAVRSAVAPGRLLEYRVSEGWEPLCEFLGVAVPDQPFPQSNEREGFDEHIATAQSTADRMRAT
jgi:hypothetical protein